MYLNVSFNRFRLHPDALLAQKALKHRRVKHYGFEFRYDNNNVDKDRPLAAGERPLRRLQSKYFNLKCLFPPVRPICPSTTFKETF